MSRAENSITIHTRSDHETREAGRRVGLLICDTLSSGNLINKRAAIALYGGLGAGKTTFVQGFARGLGVAEQYYITSPTYNIINEYPAAESLTLYHMDLYRLGSPDELEYIGFDDIASSERSVIIIEWPDIIDQSTIKFDLKIEISTDRDFNREISFIPSGLDAINLLKQFAV